MRFKKESIAVSYRSRLYHIVFIIENIVMSKFGIVYRNSQISINHRQAAIKLLIFIFGV